MSVRLRSHRTWYSRPAAPDRKKQAARTAMRAALTLVGGPRDAPSSQRNTRPSDYSRTMGFLITLIVDGALAGTVYALVALAFVVVYKSSRMINFALGEWLMLASRLVASGLHGLGLGLAGAVGLGCAGVMAGAVLFNRVVLRSLVGQPLVSLIMVTIGLGAFMRGSAAVAFSGIPGRINLPLPSDALSVQ